jgi:hypothetical protein
MESLPVGSAVVEYVATPELFSVPVPRVAVPLRNVTVPAGVPLPAGPATVAVKVTFAPAVTLAAEADNVVVVATAAGFTTRLTVLEIEDASLPSPL